MKISPKKAAVAAVVSGGLLVGGGIAAALELPDQPGPSVAEEKVADLEAPPAEPQANAEAHRQNEGTGASTADGSDAAGDVIAASGEGERPTDTHGYVVSQLATTTDEEGRDKGTAISEEAQEQGADARDEHAQNDGDHGQPEDAGQSAEARDAHGH